MLYGLNDIISFIFNCPICRGNPSNSKRYKILVGCSYGLPLVVSLLTIIVEFGAPQCASYRPRFGEESCFFSG